MTLSNANMQLPIERNRRNRIREALSGLERSERRLRERLERVNVRNSNFLRGDLITSHGVWHGRSERLFSSKSVEGMGNFSGVYVKRLRMAIANVSQRKRSLNGELVVVNRRISELERVIASGGV